MTTTDRAAYALAATVALAYTIKVEPDECTAWIESADRRCGRQTVAPWLCKRHHTVAQRRFAKEVEKVRAERAERARRREEQRPRIKAQLERIEKRLNQIDPLLTDAAPADRAVINVPVSKRLPSDARIAELAKLHKQAEELRRQLNA